MYCGKWDWMPVMEEKHSEEEEKQEILQPPKGKDLDAKCYSVCVTGWGSETRSAPRWRDIVPHQVNHVRHCSSLGVQKVLREQKNRTSLTCNLNAAWSGRKLVLTVRYMHACALSPTPRHATPRPTSWSRSLTVPHHWFTIWTLHPQPFIDYGCHTDYGYHTLLADLRCQNKNIVLNWPRKH